MTFFCASNVQVLHISYTKQTIYNAFGEQKESALAPSLEDYLTTAQLTEVGGSYYA